MADTACSCKALIIDSLLCYVSTARHSMKNDDMIRICLSFYKEAQIIKSKDTLCEILGEKGKRRRNENRLLNEMRDIVDMFTKCDDEDVSLPKFVVDSFNGIPPTSGFEVVSDNIIALIDELGNLRQEISLLKQHREEENVYRQDIMIIKEDLLAIRGDIRKINHNMMSDNIKRDSLLLENMSKSSNSGFFDSVQSVVSKYPLDISATSRCLAEGRIGESASASPSAPPLSQPRLSFTKSPCASYKGEENWNSHAGHIQDEGGSPSAPPNADVTGHTQEEEGNLSNLNLCTFHTQDEGRIVSAQHSVDITEYHENKEDNQPNVPCESIADAINQSEETSASYAHVTKICTAISAVRNSVANTTTGEVILKDQTSGFAVDKDGFRLVRNRRKGAGNIVGSRKANENVKLRGAVQVADMYLGNCNLEVTPESIIEYICNEMNIEVQSCELHESRNRNCK